MQEMTGVEQLFKETWEIYKKRVGVILPVYVISALVFIIVLGISIGAGLLLAMVFPAGKAAFLIACGLAGGLGGLVLLFWGLAAGVFAVVDEDLNIQDSFSRGGEKLWPFIWLYSISGFIIMGGFLLFMVPGVIFLTWFAFAQFIIASADERGMDAMLKSREYVRGYGFEVFLRLFAVWLVSMGVGIIPCFGPILSLLFMPFMSIFTFRVFKDLKAVRGEDVVYASNAGEKCKWIAVAAAGYLMPLIIIIIIGLSCAVPFLMLKGLLSQKGQTFIQISLLNPW